jgi:hypothetical protein
MQLKSLAGLPASVWAVCGQAGLAVLRSCSLIPNIPAYRSGSAGRDYGLPNTATAPATIP